MHYGSRSVRKSGDMVLLVEHNVNSGLVTCHMSAYVIFFYVPWSDLNIIHDTHGGKKRHVHLLALLVSIAKDEDVPPSQQENESLFTVPEYELSCAAEFRFAIAPEQNSTTTSENCVCVIITSARQ